jgi:flagellar protein FliL
MSTENLGNRPKKKKFIGQIFPVAIGILVGGGGVAAGLYFVEPAVLRAEAKTGRVEQGAETDHKEAKYFALAQPFTSNLKDSQQFVQLSISLGTYGDETFVEALKAHEMALRSAALLTIADQRYDDVATSAGKTALASTLKTVLNKTLNERQAPGQIDTVYFTGFVVQ